MVDHLIIHIFGLFEYSSIRLFEYAIFDTQLYFLNLILKIGTSLKMAAVTWLETEMVQKRQFISTPNAHAENRRRRRYDAVHRRPVGVYHHITMVGRSLITDRRSSIVNQRRISIVQ